MDEPNDVLVGRYFHTFDNPPWGSKPFLVDRQGKVLGKVTENTYLVQYHEWISGSESHQAIEHLWQMQDWYFYSDLESMIFCYEHGSLMHHHDCKFGKSPTEE
jgi:hypothetical protein